MSEEKYDILEDEEMHCEGDLQFKPWAFAHMRDRTGTSIAKTNGNVELKLVTFHFL